MALSLAALAMFGCGTSTVKSQSGNSNNGYEYVDLGLSVKWASCNVGAASPEASGNYFSWGETEVKDENTGDNYKYGSVGCLEGEGSSFTKYCFNKKHGKVDNKRTLDLSDDAARAAWGGDWRMPSLDEANELLEKCTWTWTQLNGVSGCQVTGPNGNSIFLPACGFRHESDIATEGKYGYCLINALSEFSSAEARSITFGADFQDISDECCRGEGFAVRPVHP